VSFFYHTTTGYNVEIRGRLILQNEVLPRRKIFSVHLRNLFRHRIAQHVSDLSLRTKSEIGILASLLPVGR
jgi:hypothetical protein